MGSLSDLKRDYIAKADGQAPSYYPGGKASTVAGVGLGAIGGTALLSSRRLPERTMAANNANKRVLAERIAAAQTAKGKRSIARHAQSVAQARRAVDFGNAMTTTARYRQKFLRSRGSVIAATGAGLIGYGAYAKRKNRMGGYA